MQLWEGALTKLPHRRQFLHLAAGVAALTVPRIAGAQTYPWRPVRVVVPIAAGGSNDTVARLIGQWLTNKLGKSFVVENRPGGGNNIGTEVVVRSPADGYTLLMASSANAINATLYQKLNFDFVRDIEPIASIAIFPYVLVVNPSLPATTIPEFIAYAKANPGKLSMASAGVGTPPHVAGELFKAMTGIDMVHVPYRGGAPAIADLLGGQVHIYFAPVATAIEYIKSNRLRGLAVAATKRWEELPELPTVAEFVPGFEASIFFGICAPKRTPTDIINKLNQEINAALVDLAIKSRFTQLGGAVISGSPADFRKLIADDTEKWAKVIRAANIKPG